MCELTVTNRSRAYPVGYVLKRNGYSMCSFEGVNFGPLAQLVRAPPCHGGGQGFKSLVGRLL